MDESSEITWVDLYKYYDEIEGQALATLLRERNIPIVVIPRDCSALDGIFKPSQGLGILRVREDYQAAAQEVVADFEQANAAPPAPEVPETAISAPAPRESAFAFPFIFGAVVGLLIGICIGLVLHNPGKKRDDRISSWDTNRDGKADKWAEYSEGKPVKISYDSDYNGRADWWIYFTNGERVGFAVDNDRDGTIDGWGSYEKGGLKERRWSFHNDAVIDKRAFYKDGRKVREEFDRDRNGVFETRIFYDEFERPIDGPNDTSAITGR